MTVGGDDVLFQKDLQPVGDRLEHAPPAEAVRADPVLHVGGDFALEVDEVGHGDQDHVDHHEDRDDGDHQLR